MGRCKAVLCSFLCSSSLSSSSMTLACASAFVSFTNAISTVAFWYCLFPFLFNSILMSSIYAADSPCGACSFPNPVRSHSPRISALICLLHYTSSLDFFAHSYSAQLFAHFCDHRDISAADLRMQPRINTGNKEQNAARREKNVFRIYISDVQVSFRRCFHFALSFLFWYRDIYVCVAISSVVCSTQYLPTKAQLHFNTRNQYRCR